MKLTPLRSKEFQEELNTNHYFLKVSKKDTVELSETETTKIILLNKQPAFFYLTKRLIPHLKLLQAHPDLLKKIVVDMGAVKFMISGADVMRPGIVEIEAGIEKDALVVVVDVNNHKPLAVGIALFNIEEMQAMASGKVIKNIHYVGDEIWKGVFV
jgi:PUA domain protein